MGECEMLFLIALGVMAAVAAVLVGIESLAERKVIRQYETEAEYWRDEADEYRIKYACELARRKQLETFGCALLYGNEQKEIADGVSGTADERAKV